MTASSDRERVLDQDVFDEWPPQLRALFDGTSLETKTGFTASLLTLDANGHLRTSLLGVGELYAPDSRTMCIALWPQSRAARTLAHGGRAALTFVFDDAFYQVQLDLRPLPGDEGALACLTGSIDTGEAQRVRYARLTGGITFELEDGQVEEVLDRWKRQIEHLKKMAGAVSGH
ncbi:MAG TPA: hypothetical protein VEI25_12735 [Paraburkholderia sp.]|nr:hypothetical protein [Paraburkholderia sp.]